MKLLAVTLLTARTIQLVMKPLIYINGQAKTLLCLFGIRHFGADGIGW